MNITTFSDYALRVLIYLASTDEPKSTAGQIAEAYDISFHHVAKAAQWLTRSGYIKSERGRTGGLSLNWLPKDINVGAVLKATEASAGTPLVDCMKQDGGTCCISPSCGLRFALAEAEQAFYGAMEKFTLADIAPEGSEIGVLLLGQTQSYHI